MCIEFFVKMVVDYLNPLPLSGQCRLIKLLHLSKEQTDRPRIQSNDINVVKPCKVNFLLISNIKLVSLPETVPFNGFPY